ncbi:MAG: Deacetylase family protein [Candidatus Methanohalarchaeum thermophilum]|uniref:Deacetylase family protein n=1 Tax=Methanohalarchaeum thermophilum TaxID=1903181 RepID=A0A1Q6DS61_METT1|nr:MAG: Deacetylase family protein [Candidatus Methanohalarchaeum thermophilum]
MNKKRIKTQTKIDRDLKSKPHLGLIYHQNYLLHEHSPTHPERKERLMYTLDQLKEEGIFSFPNIEVIEPKKSSREELELVHTEKYLDKLETKSKKGKETAIDKEKETILQEPTYEQAKLAAAGAIKASEVVLED